MELKNIKLAGIDLDGTLLNDDKELCKGAAEAIASAHKRGIHIVPITGRPILGIPKCVREIKEIEYIISSNGALIYDAKNAKSLFDFSIPNDKSRKIIKALRSFDCIFEPFADGVGYSEQGVFDFYMKHFKKTPLEEYFLSSRKICKSYEALFDDFTKCADEFFVSCRDEKTRALLINEINKIVDVQFCTHADRFVEITEKGTDKGSALKTLCNYLGINASQTIAFGDGENDLLFFEAAGVSVAMENAFLRVKEKADIIAKSNNDNGVCEILNMIGR